MDREIEKKMMKKRQRNRGIKTKETQRNPSETAPDRIYLPSFKQDRESKINKDVIRDIEPDDPKFLI